MVWLLWPWLCRLCGTSCPQWFARGRNTRTHGSLSADWNNFQLARRASLHIEIPVVNPWDGETADVPCWVRRVDAQNFQVFAINCAHLGCPVRWFPQSNLFLCPCHGGAYYQDGRRASGPPPRGLFPYDYKIDNGNLFIKAGEMPTTGQAAIDAGGRSTCV